MTEITLNTASCTSLIHCGQGAFSECASNISGQKFIITDTNVYKIYSRLLNEYFAQSPVFVIKAGEKSKNLFNLTKILSAMADAELKRDSTVIAFGGGVVGDIAGLAASLYMRGVRLVQIPTTLLSQVDSAVGGKTAVDFKNIKNLVGSFYQPHEVIVDTGFLKTLPVRQIRCGLGEIIKYAALDKNIYNAISDNDLFNLEFLASVIPDCIKHKVDVVSSDERDLNGARKTLNLGHTTGHALELFYKRKSHGECVLAGMYYELYIAQKLGIGEKKYFNSLRRLIEKVIRVPKYADVEKAAAFAKMDKKNAGANITLIVPEREGECAEININFDEYVRLLKEAK